MPKSTADSYSIGSTPPHLCSAGLEAWLIHCQDLLRKEICSRTTQSQTLLCQNQQPALILSGLNPTPYTLNLNP